jgi:integrase
VARTINRLTPRQVANAKPLPGRDYRLLADGGNLYLQVSRGEEGNIRRSWLFRYEMDGKRHEMGLGVLHTVGLAEARAEAKRLRQLIQQGIDPLQAKQAAERARKAEKARLVTFRQCANSYVALHEAGWKNKKHRQQWTSSLAAYVFPAIGDVSVRDIDSAAIMKVVEPLWGTKTETAARVRGRIEKVLDYATTCGFRSGDNPARHVLTALPKRSRIHKRRNQPGVPFEQMPAFMRELRERDSLAARALEFTILTAARTDEVLGSIAGGKSPLSWSEIDLRAKAWTVPAGRMKGGREHRVPLSDRVMEILRGLRGQGEHVFTLSHDAMWNLLQRMRPGMTVHGTARASFKTWASEHTNFPRAIVEKALAHAVGDETERAYDRGDLFVKRRRLMDAWAQYCSSKPVTTGATVVPLHEVGAHG